jgi:hemerythrin-like domain-containing protein
MFRELGGGLQTASDTFRAGKVPPAQFQGWFAPRLQFFLSQLHAHHQVEDYHYFPVFRAAEQRLVRGFEVLESDHETIHAEIAKVVEAANGFLRGLHGRSDAVRLAADRCADASGKLLKGLLRHLDDEEDLIVPLILDRGEQALGVG